MRRTVWRLISVACMLTFLAGRVAAHEPPDSRFDAPIPLELLFGGAALTVGLTALVLAHGSGQDHELNRSTTLLSVPASVVHGGVVLARVGFLVLVSVAVVAAVVGPQTGENLSTVVVWAVWLKGVGLVSAVAGSPWRTISPWATLLAVADAVRSETEPVAYPAWLGHAPALVGVVLVVGIVENLTTVPQEPRATAALLGAYTLSMLVGGLVFGPVWFRRADFFDVLYRLFGRVAPLELVAADDVDTETARYRFRVRSPWTGCVAPVTDTAVVAVVVAAVYTVSFDGFTNTIQYEYLLVDVGVATGTGVGVEVLVYLAGLLLFVTGFVGVVAASERVGGRDALRSALAVFAPTVLPIAVAYEVAHTYPFVLRSLVDVLSALTATVLPDPLGWLSLPMFWGSQVALITAGHVVAVVAAHQVTRRRYAGRRAATRAHVPLTVLMVGYTVLSLWIVSLPLVR